MCLKNGCSLRMGEVSQCQKEKDFVFCNRVSMKRSSACVCVFFLVLIEIESIMLKNGRLRSN